jgi:holo-[acyl-carrier protein] synthase
MIVGLGTDMIEIARIEASVTRFGDRFLQRVFTPGEIAYCLGKRNSAESLAARFAAKEAAAKALGTGISRGVTWKELEVTRAPAAAPCMRLSGRAAERAARLGVRRISVSLTHGRELGLAVVILED